jgi:hypothetical protein
MTTKTSGRGAVQTADPTLLNGICVKGVREESKRGRKAAEIPNMETGLLATLRDPELLFPFSSPNKAADVSAQTKMRTWAKEKGLMVKFTAPVVDESQAVSRNAWLEQSPAE